MAASEAVNALRSRHIVGRAIQTYPRIELLLKTLRLGPSADALRALASRLVSVPSVTESGPEVPTAACDDVNGEQCVGRSMSHNRVGKPTPMIDRDREKSAGYHTGEPALMQRAERG
jgi:hypothetical protein